MCNGLTAVRRAFLALVAGLSCGHLVDPSLPGDAERFVPPPVYERWWAMVEECSGRQGSLEAVAWYAAPHQLQNPSNPAESVEGYWSAGSNRIVLNSNDTIDGAIVRHEMLHALIRTPGHPRAAFLQGCAGVVSCQPGCVRDAGPPPTPDATTRRVSPAEVEVSSAVLVVSPSSSAQPSFATFTISAHNPFPYPIVVVLPDAGGGIPTTFSYGIIRLVSGGGLGAGDLALDIGATYFAPGETKRDVFDLVIVPIENPSIAGIPGIGSVGISLPGGTYSFSGDYGRHTAPDITTILNQ
jgi:hypothetical protein